MEKSLKEQLQEIKELHESNELTTEEYQQLRQSILAGKQESPQHSEPKGTLIGLDRNLEIGPVHARFILLEELGRGGMASVWKAKDLNESKRYGKEIIKALKFLHPDFAHSKAHYKRLQREADNAKKLRHPNIVAVYSFEQGPDGFLFLIMDYLKGRDLEEVFVDEGLGKGLSWQRTQILMTPVAEALRYAHKEHGIIHRDIKPGNLFLTDDNKIKVLDFGLAEQLKLSGSQLGMQVDDSRSGTKHYWAPEICNSGKLATTRDVYAFTAVVYELLTELPPYPDKIVCDRPDDLLPQKPENTSNAIWQELQKGLAYYAGQRPDNIQQFWNKVLASKDKVKKVPLKPKNNTKKTKQSTSKQHTNDDGSNNRLIYWVSVIAVVLSIGVVVQLISGGDPAPLALDNKSENNLTEVTSEVTNSSSVDISLDMTKSELKSPQEASSSNVIDTPLDIITPEPEPPKITRLAIEPEMAAIPAGTFTMGCKAGRDDGIGSGCDDDEKPPHKVTIAAFQMAKYEVTVGEFRTFIKASGHKTTAETKGSCWSYDNNGDWNKVKGNYWDKLGFKQTEDNPVACISWKDTQVYINWLNKEVEAATGAKDKYSLPTEAKWEYAARVGTNTAYSWGNEEPVCDKQANNGAKFDDNKACDDTGTEKVGSYKENPFGLYDMHGNVWEWVQDRWHSSYKDKPPTDGTSWDSGDSSYRVIRGGSWFSTPRILRSANRNRSTPDLRFNYLGFRLATGQD